jgi:GT2 family glycosyltransferase
MTSDADTIPTLSVVISTFNRTVDLRNALESVASQTSMPLEVLVVDDGDDVSTEKMMSSLHESFATRGSVLRHMRNPGERSLTVARNLGVDNTSGEVVLFIDDDVVLDGDYIRALVQVYTDHPEAKGVQGFHGGDLAPSLAGRLGNAVDRAFMIWFYGKDACRVLPSFNPTYPHEVSGILRCQWLSGCNMSYRREVFEELRFDDKLRRYSPSEDIDFSYRVWKRFPGSLFLTPHAHLEHRYTVSSRTPKRNLLMVQSAYRRYMFLKNMEQTVRNRMAFAWSELGRMVTSLMRRTKAQLAGKTDEPCFLELKYLLQARTMCRRHDIELRSGDLGFLNQFFDY